VTSSHHLGSFEPASIDAWNAAASEERTIDVAWWFGRGSPARSNVRLRLFEGRLIDHSPVPEADRKKVLPLAVVPPLVNAHTHLEFSTLTEPITPPTPFPDWIRSVIRWRMNSLDSSEAGIRSGLHECRQHCVATIGEITTSDDAASLLQTRSDVSLKTDDPAHIVSFRELLGFLPERIPEQVATMNRHIDRLGKPADLSMLRPGISPHAPYSVHPDLFAAVADACRSQSVPIAMHLGETKEELELLDAGSGEFKDFLQEMNLWDPDVLPHGTTILHYLQQLSTLPRSLAVHCNYLTDEEIRFLGKHPQIAVVYCPRTHHYFGHDPHPWQKIQAAGGTVVLGTDGRSSNPDLSIWKELQHLASITPQATVEELLPMVTTASVVDSGIDVFDDENEVPYSAVVVRLPEESIGRASCLLSPQSEPVGLVATYGSLLQLRTFRSSLKLN
jgi:cytosine/adenosine deaminase-related metal-dependent hydrolase